VLTIPPTNEELSSAHNIAQYPQNGTRVSIKQYTVVSTKTQDAMSTGPNSSTTRVVTVKSPTIDYSWRCPSVIRVGAGVFGNSQNVTAKRSETVGLLLIIFTWLLLDHGGTLSSAGTFSCQSQAHIIIGCHST